MDSDKTAAKEFFNVLQSLYIENELDPKQVDYYFSDNKYMASQVHEAWKQLSVDSEKEADEIAEMKNIQVNLYAYAIDISRNYCQPVTIRRSQLSLFETAETTENDSEPCPFVSEIQQLKSSRTLEALDSLYMVAKQTSLANKLLEIKEEIIKLDRAILAAYNESESSIQMVMQQNGSMPFRGSTEISEQAFTPIIIRQQGGGSIQSSIIDGTSQWIAERMREELSIAFFERFENWIEGKNIKLLFPNSFSALGSSVTTDYALMIQIFKSAFEKDLKQLPFNFTYFIEEEIAFKDSLSVIESQILELSSEYHKMRDTLRAKRIALKALASNLKEDIKIIGQSSEIQIKSEIKRLEKKLQTQEVDLREFDKTIQEAYKVLKYVLFTIKAIRLLSDGQHPTTLLSYLNANVDELFPHSGNVKSSLLILDVISRSLIASKGDAVWMGRDALVKLKNSSQFRDFYFGLVYQEIMQTVEQEKFNLVQNRNEIAKTIINSSDYKSRYTNNYADKRQAVNKVLTSFLYDLLLIGQSDPKSTIQAISETDYFKSTPKIEQAKVFALNKAHNLISSNPDIKQNFNPKTYQLLVEDIKISLKESERQLEEIYVKYAIDKSKYPINDLVRSAYQFGVPDFFPEDTYNEMLSTNNISYQAKLDKNLDNYFINTGITNPQLQQEIKAIMAVPGKLIIQEQQLVDQVTPTLKNILKQTLAEVQQEIIIPDSIRQVELLALENSDIQAIDLTILRLEKSKVFIDSILSNKMFGQIVNGFMNFANRMDNIQAEFKEIKTNGNANLGSPEFVYLMRNSLDALHQIYALSLSDDNTTVDIVQGLTTRLLDAYAAVLEKNYDAVVMNIIPVADSLLAMCYPHDLGTIAEISDNLRGDEKWGDLSKKQIKKIFKDALKEKGKDTWNKHLQVLVEEREGKLRKMHEIFKYGAFLAAVVQSRDASEIKSAIRAVALPAGSYSIKRRTYRNISLNAYPGVTGGWELAANNFDKEWAPNFGFTAPLGLGFSWGYKANINGYKYIYNDKYRARVEKANIRDDNRFLSGHSGTIFVPLIDLGAIVLFRLDNSEEAFPEDITFQQIFSPGIMYAHGLPNVPITLMGGMQMSPQLRKINQRKANSFRFNFSVVVDLPLGNLYTSKR